jgi:hypothetical protein
VSVMTRFLPRAGAGAGRLVGWAYLATLAVAAVAGTIFVLGTKMWAPALGFLAERPLFTAWFVLATMAWCIFTVQDSVLAGLKQAHWVPVENIIFAVAKIALLLLLADSAAEYGIFASWTIPGAAVLFPITALIFGRLLPRHAAEAEGRGELPQAGQIVRYAAGNYLGSMLSLLVTTLLPLLVVQRLGPSANAYFSQPWMIASALQLVAGNMAVSLTVEAAGDRERLGEYVRRSLLQSARLLVPAVALVAAGAPLLLQLFGGEYAAQGTTVLRLLALGALPNMIVMLYLSVARVRDRTGEIIAIQGAICVLTLGLSHLLLPRYGIDGVGGAWLAAQTLAAAWIVCARYAPRRAA